MERGSHTKNGKIQATDTYPQGKIKIRIEKEVPVLVHERHLSDTSEPEDARDAATDSRTRDRNDVTEVTPGIDTRKREGSSST